MYQSAEAHPGPSQAAKINLFGEYSWRLHINVFNYYYQKYHSAYLKSSDYISDLF